MSGHEIDCLCTACLRHDVEHSDKAEASNNGTATDIRIGVLARALVRAVEAVEKLTSARDKALGAAEEWMARAKASQASRVELVALLAERDAEARRRFGET